MRENTILIDRRTLAVSLGEDKSSSAGDVHAHVIATTGIAFRICLMHRFGVDAIKATKFMCIGVENDFVSAGNFHAYK